MVVFLIGLFSSPEPWFRRGSDTVVTLQPRFFTKEDDVERERRERRERREKNQTEEEVVSLPVKGKGGS